MRGIALLATLTSITLVACGPRQPETPPPPDTVIRLDTIVVTREVEPPLPDGRLTTVCLASGQSAEIRISEAGDTLIGPRRVALQDLGPAIGFVGSYASGKAWFVDDEPIVFEGRSYSRFGQAASRDCRSMKIVGAAHGLNLFAEITASSPFQVIYVPVRAGVFQSYQAQVGRVRG
jgi:hypothetical protein